MATNKSVNEFLFSASLKIREWILNYESLVLSDSFKLENNLDDSEFFYTINAFDKDDQLIGGTTVFPTGDEFFDASIDWEEATAIPVLFNTCYLLHSFNLFSKSILYVGEERRFNPLAVSYIEVHFSFWRQKNIDFTLNYGYQDIQEKLWEAECWLMKQPAKPEYLQADCHAYFTAQLMQTEASEKRNTDDIALDLGTYLLQDIENQIEIHKNSIAMPSKGMLDSIMLKRFLEDNFTLTLERTDMVSIDIVNTWSERLTL